MVAMGVFTWPSRFFFELPFFSVSHFYVGLVVFARVQLAFIRQALLQLFGKFVIYSVTFIEPQSFATVFLVVLEH